MGYTHTYDWDALTEELATHTAWDPSPRPTTPTTPDTQPTNHAADHTRPSSSSAEADDSNSSPRSHAPDPTTPIPDRGSRIPAQPLRGRDLLPLLTDPSLSTHLLCQILDLTPTQLADLLESEEVQQTLAAADRIDAIRAPRIARATLTDITADERANPETRRKAASTLARLSGQEK